MSFLSKLLGVVSGNSGLKMSDQLLFDKVIGFRGVVPGVGTSTIVQNTAIALSESSNYSICVLDTNYLYPTQYPMLLNATDGKRKDYLDFSGDISEVTLPTSYRNVHLLSLSQRTVVDMMSSRDSDLTVEKLIGALKSYFDIILVDISNELTNISTHTAIKSNRIINVADQSLKSIYYLRKSLNTMATLAVPLAKADRVVLNKVIPDVLSNTKGVLEDAGLKVIGEIPISLEIAKQGVSGKRIWASTATNKDIYEFSTVINSIIEEVIQTTPLNQKYVEPKAVEASKKGVNDSEYLDQEIEEDIIEPEVEFKTSVNGEGKTLTEEAKPKAKPKSKPAPKKKAEPKKPEPKPEPEPKPKPKPEPKPKPKPKPEPKEKPIEEPKKVEAKPEPKPEPKKVKPKLETKPEPKKEEPNRIKPKPEPKSELKSEPKKAPVKETPKLLKKPIEQPIEEKKPVEQPEVKPETKLETPVKTEPKEVKGVKEVKLKEVTKKEVIEQSKDSKDTEALIDDDYSIIEPEEVIGEIID